MSGEVLPFPRPLPTPLESAVEALLFASAEPVAVREICEALGDGVSSEEVTAALEALKQRYSERHGVVLVTAGRRWQLRTHPEHADAVARLLKVRPAKLSKAALEVLAVVAYRQPVTKSDVDALRGVDSGGVLKSLLERGLVRVTGRADVPGRPLAYGTTATFLEVFSLPTLRDLPALAERKELE